MKRDRPFVIPHEEIEGLLSARRIEYPSCGFYIGAGWIPTVVVTLDKMIAAGWDRDLSQVKQKFGGLRIYTGWVSPPVQQIISAAEATCDKLCEWCGEPHGLNIPLSGTALCPECRETEPKESP